MASVLKLVQGGVGRGAWRKLTFGTNYSTARGLSSRKGEPSEKVVLTDDGRVIVCWHPEVDVRYEFTKPLPVEATPTDTVLKVQALLPTREVFRRKHKQMMINELTQLTHTHKYVWLPKERRQRYREMNPLNVKRDREYL